MNKKDLYAALCLGFIGALLIGTPLAILWIIVHFIAKFW